MTGPLSTIRIMAPPAYTVRTANTVRTSPATHGRIALSRHTAHTGRPNEL